MFNTVGNSLLLGTFSSLAFPKPCFLDFPFMSQYFRSLCQSPFPVLLHLGLVNLEFPGLSFHHVFVSTLALEVISCSFMASTITCMPYSPVCTPRPVLPLELQVCVPRPLLHGCTGVTITQHLPCNKPHTELFIFPFPSYLLSLESFSSYLKIIAFF